eukprot:179535-Hanusia_phi.AAC.1
MSSIGFLVMVLSQSFLDTNNARGAGACRSERTECQRYTRLLHQLKSGAVICTKPLRLRGGIADVMLEADEGKEYKIELTDQEVMNIIDDVSDEESFGYSSEIPESKVNSTQAKEWEEKISSILDQNASVEQVEDVLNHAIGTTGCWCWEIVLSEGQTLSERERWTILVSLSMARMSGMAMTIGR